MSLFGLKICDRIIDNRALVNGKILFMGRHRRAQPNDYVFLTEKGRLSVTTAASYGIPFVGFEKGGGASIPAWSGDWQTVS
jgi:hypothetical protein